MNRSSRIFWLIGALLLLPQFASAQKLAPGTWTGTVAPPGDAATPVTFDVKVGGDSTSITIKTPNGEVPFTQIKVLADRLTFVFTPGIAVNCTLMLRPDKSYAGECTDGNGGKGQMVMVPPAKPGN